MNHVLLQNAMVMEAAAVRIQKCISHLICTHIPLFGALKYYMPFKL